MTATISAKLIADAPKDRHILVYSPYLKRWVVAKWFGDECSVRPRPYWSMPEIRHVGLMRLWPPKFWMELRKPDGCHEEREAAG